MLIAQQVIDLRRGVDLLLSRPDVDPKRVAYVGHSWTPAPAPSSMQSTSVSQLSSSWVDHSQTFSTCYSPIHRAWFRLVEHGYNEGRADYANQCMGRPRITLPILDRRPLSSIWASGQEWVPLKDAKDYFAMSSGPKEVKFYDSGHAFNAQARLDRFEFLHQHLGLLSLSRRISGKHPRYHVRCGQSLNASTGSLIPSDMTKDLTRVLY